MAQVETEESVHIVAYKTYVYVWVALLLLLAATIAVAKVEFSKYSVLVNLLIASIKAGLVLFFFMPVMAMIFGSSLIRDEIDDKSITHVATAPLDRAFSYVGYYLPLAISVSVSMVAISSVGMLAFYGQHGVGSDAFEIYLEFVALVIIGSFVYSSLFLMISVLFSKPVMVGLFYAFIWEGFIGSLPGAIQNASIKHYLRSVGSGWVDFGSISVWDEASSISGSAVLLLCLAVFCFILGAYLFREKELA